jgi:hypothetical protein
MEGTWKKAAVAQFETPATDLPVQTNENDDETQDSRKPAGQPHFEPRTSCTISTTV